MSLIKREHTAAWPTAAGWSDERVDRVFRDMFREMFGGTALREWLLDGQGLLRVEEYVEDGTCVIRAELPGIDPDKDVEITVEDNTLHLHAHREQRTEDSRPDGYRSEFRYGAFRRDIELPRGASAADIKATYADGVLEVRVPMPAETPTPGIKVAVEHG